jgi:hypothetical protein
MWCGLPIIDDETADSFEITQIEMDYASGIERLSEPMPVRLIVGPSGLEVIEMMPGSRRVLIPADSLIEALAETATDDAKEERDSVKQARGLTVRYREAAEVRVALFYTEDERSQSSIEQVVRIISILIRWREAHRDRTTR